MAGPQITDGPLSAAQTLKEEIFALHGIPAESYHQWLDDLPSEPPIWRLTPESIADPSALVSKLQEPRAPLETHLKSSLDSHTQQLLELCRGQRENLVLESVLRCIIEDLNRLIELPNAIFALEPEEIATLRRETREWLTSNRTGKSLAVLNRVLIEEALPGIILPIWDTLPGVFALAHGVTRSALCFSGGGIRSATFGLGVLQGFAQHGLLDRFDYLSTVSGGGYIGSWLSSWIYHAGSRDAVFSQLAQSGAVAPLAPEPEPVAHLREFSNYLTPRLGSISGDTWTLIGTYLRNLCLNWMVVLPLVFGMLMIPRLLVAAMRDAPPVWVMNTTFAIGCAGIAIALAYSVIQRPSLARSLQSSSPFWRARGKQTHVLFWACGPLFLAAICFTAVWAWLPTQLFEMPSLPWFIIGGATLHYVGWQVAALWLRRFSFAELATVIVTGAIGGGLLWPLGGMVFTNLTFSPDLELYVCLAVPVFFAVFLGAATIFVGVASRFTSDADREWWARLGAWILIGGLSWGVFTGLVLFGPSILRRLGPALCTLGGLPGIFAVVAGYWGAGPTSDNESIKPTWKTRSMKWAMGLAAPLFIAFVVAGLSFLASELIFSLRGLEAVPPIEVIHTTPLALGAAIAAVALIVGWVMARLININKFSLHSVYRNRLIRAYLGASNPHRNPNAFTGFDPKDNIPMSALATRPFHVVNMALNLVTDDNLAWQHRKAESMTASPLHIGNYRLGYRRAAEYAQNRARKGLSLGTAVTISGAAASPNQGYHSSPVVALLMTLFNVRLGAWLGNPGIAGEKTYRDHAPRNPAFHMMKEALALTNDRSSYVYLSDGGHFENLGLYEMVFRRCHYIVVSDAGCDGKCWLEDLGNAIRKIRIDLGIPITLAQFHIASRESSRDQVRSCAVGLIDYRRVDGAGAKPGIFVYLKPTICGDEPKDIYNYTEANPEFPHEPTSDQWFSEAQFESYRALGNHIVASICGASWQGFREREKRLNPLASFVRRAYTYTDVPLPPEISELLGAFEIEPARGTPGKPDTGSRDVRPVPAVPGSQASRQREHA